MSYEELEAKLGYTFKNKGLLVTALTHTSYANEKFKENGHLRSNERLEFVGDSVVGLTVAKYLYELHPEWQEGMLSKVRASVVCEDSLARLAESLGVDKFIRLGTGERQTNGSHKPSILSDAMESIVAAIFMDSDYETVKAVILPFFKRLVDTISVEVVMQDCKSRLQERLGKDHVVPKYSIVGEDGPAHDRTFTANVFISTADGDYTASGTGKTKRDAEQHAAGKLLELLEQKK